MQALTLLIVKLVNKNFEYIYLNSIILKCLFFLVYNNLGLGQQYQQPLNSIHSIRYLWLQKLNKNFNYFNLADNDPTLETIYKILPIFKKADDFFKEIHMTTLKKLNLNDKEISLFASLMLFVGGTNFSTLT